MKKSRQAMESRLATSEEENRNLGDRLLRMEEEKLQKKEREQAARAKERRNARGSVVADLDDIALWPKSDC